MDQVKESDVHLLRKVEQEDTNSNGLGSWISIDSSTQMTSGEDCSAENIFVNLWVKPQDQDQHSPCQLPSTPVSQP